MNVHICGIDEAGRGPLIGDMFIAMIVINTNALKYLENIGVRDSKKLSKEKRIKLFPIIIENSELVLISRLTPSQLDEENINKLELNTVCRLIKESISIVNTINEIYIDAFANPNKLLHYVNSNCIINNRNINIHIEHRADTKYVVVGAASIVAKVLRDTHIDNLKKVYGDFGSGYPSDKKTIEWLRNYYAKHNALPPIVRKSWSTITRVLGIPKIHKEGVSKSLLDYVHNDI